MLKEGLGESDWSASSSWLEGGDKYSSDSVRPRALANGRNSRKTPTLDLGVLQYLVSQNSELSKLTSPCMPCQGGCRTPQDRLGGE